MDFECTDFGNESKTETDSEKLSFVVRNVRNDVCNSEIVFVFSGDRFNWFIF